MSVPALIEAERVFNRIYPGFFAKNVPSFTDAHAVTCVGCIFNANGCKKADKRLLAARVFRNSRHGMKCSDRRES